MHAFKKMAAGRVLLLRWEGALDGSGPPPQRLAEAVRACGARFLLLDTTQVPYADSDGLRWLVRLRAELEAHGRRLRLAVRPHSKVWRSLALLHLGLEVYGSLRAAWKPPRGQSAIL